MPKPILMASPGLNERDSLQEEKTWPGQISLAFTQVHTHFNRIPIPHYRDLHSRACRMMVHPGFGVAGTK